jgi:osmotically-inducible protein OsmY
MLRPTFSFRRFPMGATNHALVWIDHSAAKVSRFRGNAESDVDIHADAPLQRLHHLHTGWVAGGRVPENTDFYQQIAVALDSDSEIVITGPGNAKLEFKAFLDQHRPQMSSRVEEVTQSDIAANPGHDRDRDLEQNVSDELDWDAAVDSHGLAVTASGGIVTITGHVRHYSQQHEVERLAQTIAGVKGVILRVDVDSTDESTDAELARFAAAAVATTIDLGAEPIDIQVNAGWITLRGSVTWEFQRCKVMNAVGALRGVLGINNMMTLRTTEVPAAKMKSSIESALQRLVDARHQRIGVSVIHGVVTLTGAVTSGWQRAMVVRSAWNAVGVRSVRNELVVEL